MSDKVKNEQDLYNLVHSKIKIPFLHPISSPLPLINTNKIHLKLSDKRGKSSPNLYSKFPSTSSIIEGHQQSVEIFKPKLPKSFYIIKLKEWAEEIPISGLMPLWESNIISMIPNSLKTKYPKYLAQLLREIKLIYIEDMQEFAISSIVINDKVQEFQENTIIIPTEKPLVTQNNELFLKNQKHFQKNYFLSNNLMKQIISTARQNLTSVIVDFSNYHTLGLLSISDFHYMIYKNIRNSTLIIKHDYHKEIMKKIITKKYLKTITKTDEPKFMHCATNLFIQQIIQYIMETITIMLNTIKNIEFCPQLNFELIITKGIENLKDFELNISLSPSIENVCNIYHQVINDISNIVKNDLLCFKCKHNDDNKYIWINLPDWFLKKSHDKLSKILNDLFQPLRIYFSNIVDEFTYVCSPITRDFIINLVSENRDFSVYCNHVKHLNTYLSKTNKMVSYLYYNVGRLSQINAKHNLHTNISELIKILMDKMINYHWDYNKSIYNEFKYLENLALDIPKNTKALFKLSETILLASTVTVKKLEKKIEKSVEMLSELLQLTNLSKDHIEFNKLTINYLFSIGHVFTQSNILCEAMKSELEDELQRKINILNNKVEEMIPEFIIMNNMDDANRVHQYIKFLKLLVAKIHVLDKEIAAINCEEKLFKFPETLFSRFNDIKHIILPFYNLNRMIFLWKRHNNVWLDGPFEYIDSSKVENITLNYFQEFTQFNKTIKTKIKLDMTIPNKPFKFSGLIDDPDPMQQPAPLKLCFQVIQSINEFKQYIRLINCMCNPALTKRHWNEMSIIYGSDITPNAGTTLRKIIALDLMENIDRYEVISISADKELALKQQLNDMAKEWDNVRFDIGEDCKDKKRLIFINLESDIQIKMEEHLVKIQEMRASYFVKPITDDVDKFHKALICVRDTIDMWNLLYDELIVIKPIFEFTKRIKCKQSEQIFDICEKIEECLSSVKSEIMENPTFHKIGRDINYYLNKLKPCLMYIEIVNEKIHNYLTEMRNIFPRFFFLSDKEIVDIIFSDESDQNRAGKVVKLLKKCFYGINNVKLNFDGEIIGIISDYNQVFNLTSSINPERENWLINTENSIIETVKTSIDSIIKNNHDNSNDFINTFIDNIFSISMVILKISWTCKIENYLQYSNENPLKKFNSMLETQNSLIISIINELKNKDLCKKNFIKNKQLILITLTSVLIHQRDILSLLIDKIVINDKDFHWVSQLRHYYIDKSLKIKMIYETKNYGYEFNSIINSSIINTPLTDRIYHTIFQASRNNYFCSLIGSANTGKTETVKNLAINELGLQFYLINCTKNLTCERVSSLLKGIIYCGAWLTFKNINYSQISILSAITEKFSQILKIISKKKLKNSNNWKFEDFDIFKDLSRIKYSGFITTTIILNPGRFSHVQKHVNIPNNLRVIFRPITIHHPDLEKILKVNLLSSGFNNAKIISKKMMIFLKLCSEQFDSKHKYMFGLRSLISIIKNVVRLKFQFPEEVNEESIIFRSIIDVYLGILRQNDVPIFLGFLRDIFPHIHIVFPPPDYTNFLKIIDELSLVDVFEIHDNFKLKIIQILEIMHIKQSFIIVGESHTGKTKILKILSKCLKKLYSQNDNSGNQVFIEIINHKSIKLKNLFGYNQVINNNKKWVDGICTLILRNLSNNNFNDKINELNLKKFLIFDGPIDSFWMENLSTILDQHKTLFLDSGEGIKIPETISIIFETENLNNSTPAMISRCGIIHMETDTIDWQSHMRCWVIEQNSYIQSEYNHFMINFLNWTLEFVLKFLKNYPPSFLNVSKVFSIMSILKLLKIYLLNALEINKIEGTCGNFNIHFKIWFQAALILSIIWGMSGILYSDELRNKLDEYCVSIWNQKSNKKINQQPSDIITLPGGLIQDHNYIFKGAGIWKPWTEIIKNSTQFFINSKFIPTLNTIPLISIFESHIRYKIPFIICGDRSIGKTTMIEFILKKKYPKNFKNYLSNIFNFTSQIISTNQAQKYFLLKINRIITGRYIPNNDKYSIINFIDDLNMMKKEDDSNNGNLGSSLELIRQLLDHGYWFSSNNKNEKKFQKIKMENVMFLSVLTRQKNNNFNEISPRFIRHFNLYSMSSPSEENIFKIFSTLLLNNLKKNQFSADVSSSVNSMIHATIQIYNSIISNKNLLPIPMTNFNYQFNLKDIERVINGCSLIHRESAESKITLIRILVHESIRVFGDRLTNKYQKNWLLLTIKEAINIHFNKESFDSIFDHLPKHNDQLTSESFENFMFCNFIDSGDYQNESLLHRRRYEEITCSQEILKTKLISHLTLYNETVKYSKKMDIIIFSDIVYHIIRLCRCLCTPSGNFLMLSMSGGSTGRKTLTMLASFIEKCKFFELTNNSNWKKDLKRATKYITESGGMDCCFFIPCRYLKYEHLMDINCLMSNGEIPNLFSDDYERQEIIELARLPAQNGDCNLEIGIIEVMNYFYEQCQEKLHFILYINLFDETKCKTNSNYQLLKSYPNILNSCLIDCFDNWPQEAIQQLSIKFLHNLTVINSFTKDKVISAAVNIYEHSRLIKPINNYTTTSGPYGFINMMKLYSKIIIKKHEKINESHDKYQIGLAKLQYAEQQVSKMKSTLTDLKPQLEQSAKQMEETMREIKTENIIVENATIQLKRDEEIANKTVEIAAILKSECEADLAVAIPILEDAIAALNTLKPADITLVKAMKNPPDTVKLVMAAVCVMLNVSSDRIIDPVTGKKSMDYWGPSKRILGEMNFLQMLKDYDKNNIPANVMMIIKKTYMNDNSFMPHIVAKASSAAEGLCKWVRAMVSYDEIAKIVAPKKEKLALAEKECNESLAFLNKKRKTLAELTSKLTTLNETLSDTLVKKIQLESQVKSCIEKLKKSEALIASLDVEKIKWKKTMDSLKILLETLAGDILISSGIIAFLSSFDETHRYETIEKWKDIIHEKQITISKSYNFLITLESQIIIDSWKLSGLSKNRFYTENIVIMKNINNHLCILIDPQNQAKFWIEKIEEKNNLKIFKSSEIHLPHYRQQIKIFMENNYPILLENLGEGFNPSDLDMINHQLKLQNDDLNKQQLVYMTTKLHNPSFHPYILKKTNIINFHLPEKAIHEQLLDIVLSREQPELYEKFNNLNIESHMNKQILQQEENNILATLSSTSTPTASILEDERALKILKASKKLLMEIIQKEKAENEAKKEIDKFKKYYSNFTSYSASFYQTLISLAALNSMYQYSLLSFTQLFIKSIDTCRQSSIIEKRLKYLKRSFTQTLYYSVRNSLFEDHKIIYSFLLCLNIISNEYDIFDINSKEINYFFETSKYFFNLQSKSFNFFHQFSSEKFEKLNKLEKQFPVYEGIVESLKNDENLWKKFLSIKDFEDDDDNNNNLPIPWNSKLSIFQQLLLIKILKPEKLVKKINRFIDFVMKKFDISPPISTGLGQSYLESTCLIPLIFILPTYREPLKMIIEYGKKFGYTSKIFTISLGGPKDSKIVEDLILHCQKEGSWVFIQNCHLADASTMLILENIYEHQGQNTFDALLGFRLWLSSLPSDNFPIEILQDGIKITDSPPKDLKDCLINCYQSDPLNKINFFTSCPGKDKIFSMMIYGFCLFHSILRERKKFGMQGWNVDYEFLPSDFNISVRQLENLLKIVTTNNCDRNYFIEGIFYLVGRCNYGGRIINEEDEKFVDKILKDFCNEKIGIKKNYCIIGEDSKGCVRIPDRCEYKDFVKHVENIDNCDEILQVFGLDNNVKIMKDLYAVGNFFDSLNLMNLIDKGENDESRKNKKELKNIWREKILQIENQLPEFINIEEVKYKCHFKYLKPLNYILIEEINDFNLTIEKFKLFSENRDSTITNDLTIDETISFYELIKILNERSIFLKNWIDNEFPKYPIKLNLISSPKKLFSAIKLMFSRICFIDVTKISLKSEILGFNKNSEENLELINNEKSIYIEGLFLSGGRWDEIEEKLVVNGALEFWNTLPIVHITPDIIENCELRNFDDKFLCPLYKSVILRDLINFSGNLENFIGSIELKSDFSTDFWIKRGTALFCHHY